MRTFGWHGCGRGRLLTALGGKGSHEGVEFRWSVLVLVLWLVLGLLSNVARAAGPAPHQQLPPSILGRYRAEDGSLFDFRADGSVLIDSSVGRYVIEGDQLILTDAKTGQQKKVTYRLTDEGLVLIDKDRGGRFVRVGGSKVEAKPRYLVGRYVSTAGVIFRFWPNGRALLGSSVGTYRIEGDELEFKDTEGRAKKMPFELRNNVLVLGSNGRSVRFLRIPDIPFHCGSLLDAAAKGDFLCVERRTRVGKDINAWKKDRPPALCWATANLDRDVTELLLSRGADANVVCGRDPRLSSCRGSGHSVLLTPLAGRDSLLLDVSSLFYLVANLKSPKYEELEKISGLSELSPRRISVLKLLFKWGAHLNECDRETLTFAIQYRLELEKQTVKQQIAEAKRKEAEAQKLAAYHRANMINDVVSVIMMLLFVLWAVSVTFHLRYSLLAFSATILSVIVHLLLWHYYPKHDSLGNIVGMNNSPVAGLVAGLTFFGMGLFFRAAVNFIGGHRIPFENPIRMWIRFVGLSLKRIGRREGSRYVFSASSIFARLVFSFPLALMTVIVGKVLVRELLVQSWSEIDLVDMIEFKIMILAIDVLSILLIWQDYVE